ncbi:Uncharacterized protein APZ42_013239 [Daphnia magna]|uniref:Uncharacterized protein n=1 Tax=Daphnia magna TaxID=35525 RepID=A0A162R448_9CRUS|nr:Uncharacterized protein APZ42_013239 [Daphnia magna]
MQIYSRRHVTIVFNFEKKKEDGEEKNLENEERKKERKKERSCVLYEQECKQTVGLITNYVE